MTREELLKDEWVKENFGDACYPNYLEPNFESGVEYGEREMIDKAYKWLAGNIDYILRFYTEGDRDKILKDFLSTMRK